MRARALTRTRARATRPRPPHANAPANTLARAPALSRASAPACPQQCARAHPRARSSDPGRSERPRAHQPIHPMARPSKRNFTLSHPKRTHLSAPAPSAAPAARLTAARRSRGTLYRRATHPRDTVPWRQHRRGTLYREATRPRYTVPRPQGENMQKHAENARPRRGGGRAGGPGGARSGTLYRDMTNPRDTVPPRDAPATRCPAPSRRELLFERILCDLRRAGLQHPAAMRPGTLRLWC